MKNQLLSAKLKELRKVHGYTQDDVAAALQIVRQTYSHYETGKRTPSAETLYKLAGFFEISIDDLLQLTIDVDKDVYFDAPSSTQSSDELSDFLNFYNKPTQKKKYQYLNFYEKELLFYFNQISIEDKKEIIEFTKIKSKKKSHTT